MLELDRRGDPAQRERFDRLQRELLVRLARVFVTTPQHEIEALASVMIRVRLKYERVNGLSGPTRPL